ncbi:MAG: hypothetical protein ACYDHP_13905 [Ferrimicrobium sp.]
MSGDRRRSRVRLLAVWLLGSSLLLSGCGQGSSTNASNACRLVTRSITIFMAAEHGASTTRKSADSRALMLLREALPLANVAAGSNSAFQPLAATLSETNRVGEQHLLAALQAQCATTGSQLGEYVSPSTTPSTG